MNLERYKSGMIATHEYAQTLLLWLGVVAVCIFVYALWTWRNAENVVGATSADVQGTFKELRGVIKGLDDKIAAVDTSKLNGRLDDLGKTQEQLTGLISDTRANTNRLTNAAIARVNQLGENLASLKGVTDEVSHQVKQNGDAAALTLASLNKTAGDVDTRFTKILDDGTVMLETANLKLQDLLAHADAVVVTADGTIKAYEPVGVKLTSVLGHVDNMAADSDLKWHSLLFPPPVKGFWNRTKTYAAFALHSAFDGASLYYRIKAVPVNIVRSVPIFAPKP